MSLAAVGAGSLTTVGNLYRNNGDGNGSFGPWVRIPTGWQGRKGIFQPCEGAFRGPAPPPTRP